MADGMQRDMPNRAFHIHMARVYLAQARVWRHRAAELPWYWHSFWQSLEWAAKCRREAASPRELAVQGDLFRTPAWEAMAA